MMSFHPTTKAFFEPIGAGIVAFIFAGMFGAGLGMLVNVDPAPGAIVWGSAFAVIVWTVDHYAWLLIVARSYGPPPPVVVEPEIEPEVEPTEGRYLVTRVDKTGSWVIQPGCSIEQLGRFAVAICHDELTTTYQNMVVNQRIFQQQEYRDFIGWMVSQGFAMLEGNKGECKLTDLGKYFVKCVFERGIMLYSPATA